MIQLNAETERLQRSLALYRELRGKTAEEVLLKKGGNLAYELSQGLHDLAPAKGQVRAERIDALKAGYGVHVRDRIKQRILTKYGARIDLKSRALVFGKAGGQSVGRKGGKRLNLRALMVEAELNTRESGRGFLARSSRYPRELVANQASVSRFGPLLSTAGLNDRRDILTMEWSSSNSELSGSAAQGLSKDKAEEKVNQARSNVTDDIREYLSRKLAENGRKAGLS